MATGINNGKHITNNIFIIKLISVIIAVLFFSASSSAMKNGKGWVIVIDAGHGGKDPGAIGANSCEKNITLAIALKTGEYIQQNIKNVTVIYTRDNDSFVELRDRANIANKHNADLFISIHVNWAESKSIHGTETFIMGLAKDEQNLEVAMKENEVILLENDHTTKYEGFDPKSPESYIMFTLMQNIFQEQSTNLASNIQIQYKEKIDRTDRGVKQAGFWVLFMTTMPSVLTETGFITNPAEEKFLNSKQGQDYLASSIFRACKDYINEIDSKSVILTGKNQLSEPKQKSSNEVISNAGEIVFMVQVTTSAVKNEIKPENFKGLKDVVEIDTQDRFRYATGSFSDYAAAVKYRKKIEVLYPDAFVIAVKDNKVLPLQQALEKKK
ncbi:MAG: N-acetylmuramoyl-L-alanine amidase [Bacteroidetes bacterium]|nr:MAG: N-acetylmuramoyl-L-alanine amidase [Bacteroidota bacterium]